MIDDSETSEGFSKPIEIVTPELGITLRQFALNDAPAIFNLIVNSKKHLTRFASDVLEKYKTYEDVEESIRSPRDPNKLRFGIWNDRSQLVGTINLTPVLKVDQTPPVKGEVGYYLGSEFTRKGYMRKAIKTLCDFAFDKLGWNEIFAEVEPNNESSKRVLIKAGFRYIGLEKGLDVFEIRKTSYFEFHGN